MLEKEMKILVSFGSAATAMGFEKFCKASNIEGRMIPLPREISAGCGICWISPIEIKDKVISALKISGYKCERIHEMEI